MNKIGMNIIESLKNQKCFIADCDSRDCIMIDIVVGLLVPICMNHFEIYMKRAPKWNAVAKKVYKALSKSKGEFVRIENWEEMKARVKPEFIAVATNGLELTKGKCIYCGEKAIGIVTPMTPVCEKHMGFPRRVDKVALKEIKIGDHWIENGKDMKIGG